MPNSGCLNAYQRLDTLGERMYRLFAYHDDVKGAIEYTNDFCRSDDSSELLSQVVNEIAEVQVRGLLLGKLGSI
jgi:hypothetical protein